MMTGRPEGERTAPGWLGWTGRVIVWVACVVFWGWYQSTFLTSFVEAINGCMAIIFLGVLITLVMEGRARYRRGRGTDGNVI
jgi:hypothetical protein